MTYAYDSIRKQRNLEELVMQDSPGILLSPPDVGILEQEYVLAALRSGWVAPAGRDLTAFEDDVADRVRVSHALGLSSGNAALRPATKDP